MQGLAADETVGHPILERHRNWWDRGGHLCAEVTDQPLRDLWLPLADGSVATADMEVQPEMLDLDRLAASELRQGTPVMQGDLFRVIQPYVRVPWVEAILGAPFSRPSAVVVCEAGQSSPIGTLGAVGQRDETTGG